MVSINKAIGQVTAINTRFVVVTGARPLKTVVGYHKVINAFNVNGRAEIIGNIVAVKQYFAAFVYVNSSTEVHSIAAAQNMIAGKADVMNR